MGLLPRVGHAIVVRVNGGCVVGQDGPAADFRRIVDDPSRSVHNVGEDAPVDGITAGYRGSRASEDQLVGVLG